MRQKWICDYCDHYYEDKEQAEKCEVFHRESNEKRYAFIVKLMKLIKEYDVSIESVEYRNLRISSPKFRTIGIESIHPVTLSSSFEEY